LEGRRKFAVTPGRSRKRGNLPHSQERDGNGKKVLLILSILGRDPVFSNPYYGGEGRKPLTPRKKTGISLPFTEEKGGSRLN